MTGLFALGTSHFARYTAAGAITLVSVFIVAVLWRELAVIPDPGLLLLFTVAAATYLAGGMAGMLSAAIVLFCSFYLFSHPAYPFRYSDLDWRQMMAIVIACPLIALMVGSLKEQVEKLALVSAERDALQDEVRRLEAAKDAHFLCERRFRLVTEYLLDYAVCTLDAKGTVSSWNAGAERVTGYSDPEILGQSYSRFFTREDLLARRPERLLEVARFTGRAEEEGWKVRKGNGRFRARLAVVALRNAANQPAGFVLVMRDLTESDAAREALGRTRAEIEGLKPTGPTRG
jgi:PAS domain S-box-containing protein